MGVVCAKEQLEINTKAIRIAGHFIRGVLSKIRKKSKYFDTH
jgi:hypothetical protein